MANSRDSLLNTHFWDEALGSRNVKKNRLQFDPHAKLTSCGNLDLRIERQSFLWKKI